MKDKFLSHNGNKSSIRLNMILYYILSVFLCLLAFICSLNGISETIIAKIFDSAIIFSLIGTGGKAVQGIAENFARKGGGE